MKLVTNEKTNSRTAKIRTAANAAYRIAKYAFVVALVFLLTAVVTGMASGYWIISERSDTAENTFAYSSEGMLDHYVKGGVTVYNGKEQFPVVSAKTVDGSTHARDLDFTPYVSGGDNTEYFNAFAYSYAEVNNDEEFNAIKNGGQMQWTSGRPINAGDYAIKISAANFSNGNSYGATVVRYTIAPATATTTIITPVGNAVTAKTSAQALVPSVTGNAPSFIYNGASQGIYASKLYLGDTDKSYAVAPSSDYSTGSIEGFSEDELKLVFTENLKSDVFTNGEYYPVTAKLEGSLAKNYLLNDGIELKFRVIPVTVFKSELIWKFSGSTAISDSGATVYDGTARGYSVSIDAEAASSRIASDYNEPFVKNAVSETLQAYSALEVLVEATANCAVESDGKIKHVGSYEFTATIVGGTATAPNANVSLEGGFTVKTVTVTPKLLTCDFNASSFVYNGTEQTPTYTLTGFAASETSAVLNVTTVTAKNGETASPVNAGDYSFTVTVSTVSKTYCDYAFNVSELDKTITSSKTSVNFAIDKKALSVTANPFSVIFGDEKPALTTTASGFVGGESYENYGVTEAAANALLTCAYQKGSSVGTYPITFTEAAKTTLEKTLVNYSVTPVDGTLTVTAKPVDIIWANTTGLVYDGVQKTVYASYTDINGSTVSATVSYDKTPLNAGDYVATATVLDGNYVIKSGKTANFTVDKAPVTISIALAATSLPAESDVSAAGITHSVSNGTFYDEFSNSVLQIVYTLTGGGVTVDATSPYTLTEGVFTVSARLDGNKAQNYALTVNSVTLTVTKKVSHERFAPTAVKTSLVYNGTVQTLVLNGFDETAMNVTANSAENAGDYVALITLKDGYSWADGVAVNANGAVEIKWNIAQADLTVKGKNATIVYGEAFSPEYEITSGTLYGSDTLTAAYTLLGDSIVDEKDYSSLTVGNYTLQIDSATAGDNYSVTRDGDGTVTVKAKTLIKPTAEQTSFVYNGTAQTLDLKNFDETVMNRNDEVASCVNVGNYRITVSLKDAKNYAWQDGTTADITFTLTVTKLQLRFNGVIEVDYNANGFTITENLLRSNLTVLDGSTSFNDYFNASGGTPTDTINSASANDGNGHILTLNATGKTGSTYLVAATATDNYVFASNGNTVVLKYKTAKIGSVYYTIEDAISQNSSTAIILQGGSPYVETWFTNLTVYNQNKEYTLNNKNLVVPHNADVTESTTSDRKSFLENSDVGTNAVYSALVIPKNVTLNLSKTLDITAFVSFNQPNVCVTYERGVVMNNGTVNVKSGGRIYAYGYFKGAGKLNLEEGATATDLFRIIDFKGGGITDALNGKNVFPVDAYSIHNISCTTYINKGAIYNAYYAISVKVGITIWAVDTITIVGTANDSSALFKLDSGYIEKSATKAKTWSTHTELDTITGSNQVKGQRDALKLHGTAIDGQIKINISGYKMETSPSTPLPVSYMDVTICKGSTLTLQNTSYKFLAGSAFTVEDGATLVTDTDIQFLFYTYDQSIRYEVTPNYTSYNFSNHCIDKVDSTLTVNGTANLKGTVTGKIHVNKTSAKLSVAKVSATVKYVTDVTKDTFTYSVTVADSDPMYASGDTVDGDSTLLTANASYTSHLNNEGSKIVWANNDRLKTVSFNKNGGNLSGVSSKQIILNAEGKYVIPSGFFPTATKQYFTFDGWYTAKTGGEKLTVGSVITDSVTLYARYNGIEYGVSYQWIDDDWQTLGAGFAVSEEPSLSKTFVTGDVYVLPDTLTNTDASYFFLGWFDQYDNPITQINQNIFPDLLIDETVVVYGKWTRLTPTTLTVTLVIDNLNTDGASFAIRGTTGETATGNTVTVSTTMNEEGVITPQHYTPNVTHSKDDLTKLDLNYGIALKYYDYGKQFGGWYTNEARTNAYDPSAKIDGDITLYAKWTDKTKITLTLIDQAVTDESGNGRLETFEKFIAIGSPFKNADVHSSVVADVLTKKTIVGQDMDKSQYGYKYNGSFTLTLNGTALPNDEQNTAFTTSDVITVSVNYAKIIKVTVNMSATANCDGSHGMASSKLDNTAFSISQCYLNTETFYSTDAQNWKNSADLQFNKTGTTTFFTTQTATLTITIPKLTCTGRKPLSSNSCGKVATCPAPTTSGGTCSTTTASESFTFTPNGSYDMTITWNASVTAV